MSQDRGLRPHNWQFTVWELIDLSNGQILLGCFPVQGIGDEACHFKVHTFRDTGYTTLESTLHRGMFVGMTSDGRVRPTVDTGQKNIRFYPEVIHCKLFFFKFVQ